MKKRSAYFLLVLFIATACQAQLFQKKSKSGITNNPTGPLVWSQHRGSFNQFLQQASRSKTTAVIDKDVTTNETVTIDGDITVQGSGITITASGKNLFILGAGNHVFSNFNVVQRDDESVTFFTKPEVGIVWNNTLRNINITGGKNGYESSRGGQYHAPSDSVLQWAGTTIENSVIIVKSGSAISVFAQDGPAKFLHLRNVQMGTDVSHNIYIHPNVSFRFDSVVSLYAGKLAMHQYSGGNHQFYFTSHYSEMHRVQSLKGGMWEMIRPRKGHIIITDSDISPYTTMGVENPFVYATNTRFYNAGNGAFLTGKLINCRGVAWSGSPTELDIEGGDFSEISFRPGGKITVSNATIDQLLLADRGNNFEGLFTGCTINNLQDFKQGEGKIILRNSTVKNSNARPGVVVKQ